MQRKGLVAFCALLGIGACWPLWSADGVTVMEGGPIHEAFVTPTPGDVVLVARAEQPPEPVREKGPVNRNPAMKWIPGHWAWDNATGTYVWVSGVLRRPPPEHRWIPGKWQQTDEGWIWLQGFWSAIPEGDLDYIEKTPPEPLEEEPGEPQEEGSFWMPGYWQYDEDRDDYEWLQGSWQKLDPNWVLTPAYYTWREEGYLFHPPFWDWPVDERGTAYANVSLDPLTGGQSYEPVDVVEPVDIIRRLSLYYPDYITVFSHHYYYHPRFWSQYWGTPPWWRWEGWWSLPWRRQWALWWWYVHPGYPAPFWLQRNFVGRIPPPKARLLRRARNLVGPPIVTPHGVIAPKRLYGAMNRVEGSRDGRVPIIPADPKIRQRILERAEPQRTPGRFDRPSGRRPVGPQAPEERVPAPRDPGMRERSWGRSAPQPTLPRSQQQESRESLRSLRGRPRPRQERPERQEQPEPTRRRESEGEGRPSRRERSVQQQRERQAEQPAARPAERPAALQRQPARSQRASRPERPPGAGRNLEPLPPRRPRPQDLPDESQRPVPRAPSSPRTQTPREQGSRERSARQRLVETEEAAEQSVAPRAAQPARTPPSRQWQRPSNGGRQLPQGSMQRSTAPRSTPSRSAAPRTSSPPRGGTRSLSRSWTSPGGRNAANFRSVSGNGRGQIARSVPRQQGSARRGGSAR